MTIKQKSLPDIETILSCWKIAANPSNNPITPPKIQRYQNWELRLSVPDSNGYISVYLWFWLFSVEYFSNSLRESLLKCFSFKNKKIKIKVEKNEMKTSF